LDSREISLLIPRGSVVDDYSRSAFFLEEFGVWTVHEMADRRAPGAVLKYWAQGQDLWFGRDQFDAGDYGLAEIRSTSVPTTCRRSVLPVCPQLVGDRPLFLMASFVPSGSLLLLDCVCILRRDIQVPLHDELFESRPAFQGRGHIPTSR